jgi:hypothetical protein
MDYNCIYYLAECPASERLLQTLLECIYILLRFSETSSYVTLCTVLNLKFTKMLCRMILFFKYAI